MAQAGADAGLPLPDVLSDLRLALDLDDGDEMPVDTLRAVALAWAERHHALRTRIEQHRAPLHRDPEDTLWDALAAPGAAAPRHGIVIEVTPLPTRHALFRDADLTLLAAEAVRATLGASVPALVVSTHHVLVLVSADDPRASAMTITAGVRAGVGNAAGVRWTVEDLGDDEDRAAVLRALLSRLRDDEH